MKSECNANIDMEGAFRIFVAENSISNKTLAVDLDTTETTISTLRSGEIMSGKNLKIVCSYFKITGANFMIKGQC